MKYFYILMHLRVTGFEILDDPALELMIVIGCLFRMVIAFCSWKKERGGIWEKNARDEVL